MRKNTCVLSVGLMLLLLFVLQSCVQQETDKDATLMMHEQSLNEAYVDTMVLHVGTFKKQIFCNGKLRAKTRADLVFRNAGVLSRVCVKDGMRLEKGSLIASLDKTERQQDVEKAEQEQQRAYISLVDKLIGQGYGADLKSVPEDVRERAEVATGYFTSKHQLVSARRALEECDLYAPFSGRVANVTARPFERGDKVCTLIDDSEFEVEFSIMEAELAHVREGMDMRISPFVNDTLNYTGVVAEINPMVDDRGLIAVTARLKGRGRQLVDGMNVRVVIEENMQDMFVVPKDAVVERDGYHVIFRYKDGRAVWTYVDVLHSNIDTYAITGCRRKSSKVHEGDVLITSGNLNLADHTEVMISTDRH